MSTIQTVKLRARRTGESAAPPRALSIGMLLSEGFVADDAAKLTLAGSQSQ